MSDVNKIGLVLEGGAMRGMFTAGVIDVLMESSIEFDGAIGVSAGAAFGCNYKSKQIGRVIDATLTEDKIAEFRTELMGILNAEDENFTVLHEGVIIKLKRN